MSPAVFTFGVIFLVAISINANGSPEKNVIIECAYVWDL